MAKTSHAYRWFDQGRLLCDHKRSDLSPRNGWYPARAHFAKPPVKPTAAKPVIVKTAPSLGKGGKSGSAHRPTNDGGIAAKFRNKIQMIRDVNGNVSYGHIPGTGRYKADDLDYN
jgi:hypothetical protein